MSDRKSALRRLSPVLCCAVCLATFIELHGDDWPRFRGARGDGVAEGEKLPTWFNASSNLLWKADMPTGHSSPLLWKKQLFVTAERGNQLLTRCLDTGSGKQRWEKVIDVEKLEPVHEANSHATSTPATDGRQIYVYFGSFGVLCYDLEGKEIWRKQLPVPKTFFNQGTGTSPVLADGKLLAFVQIGSDSHLLAMKPSDGAVIWKAAMPEYNNSYATPVVWQENGKGFVGMTCAGRFTAFNLAEGKESWWLNGLPYQACSTPVAAGDRLVITIAGVQGEVSNITPPPTFAEMIKKYDRNADGLLAVEEIPEDLLYTDRQTSDGKGNMTMRRALAMFGGVKESDKLNEEKWEGLRNRLSGFRTGPMNKTLAAVVRTGGEKDVTASHVVWKETRGVPEVPSPLVWKDRIYLIRSGGLLVCRDLETGKLIYDERLDSPGGYFASPILAENRIYVASDRGTVTVVKTGDKCEVLARNELADPILASPAVSENTLYIRSSKQLWAFKETGK